MDRYGIIGMRGEDKTIITLNIDSPNRKEFIKVSSENVGYDHYKLVKFIGSLEFGEELMTISKEDLKHSKLLIK